MTSAGLVFFFKHRNNKKKKETDGIDQNPDYGYSYEGVDYQESAIKDTNIYYGDDEDDYQDTFVQDANT